MAANQTSLKSCYQAAGHLSKKSAWIYECMLLQMTKLYHKNIYTLSYTIMISSVQNLHMHETI